MGKQNKDLADILFFAVLYLNQSVCHSNYALRQMGDLLT